MSALFRLRRLVRERNMAKKSIGIDIGRFHVRAVQMTRTAEGLRVEKTFGMHTRRSTDSPVDILRELIGAHGFDRKAEVVVSLPHHAVFFADAQIDAAQAKRLAEAGAALLKDSFPIPAEEAILQVCSARPLADERHSVLVAATASELLREELDLLSEAHIRPVIVDTAITATHTAVMVNHPEAKNGIALLCCVDESLLSLAVTQDGQILMVRNIPLALPRGYEPEALATQVADVLTREIDITWRKLFGAEPQADLRVFLSSASGTGRLLATAIEGQIDCQATVVDPYAHIEAPARADAGFPVCVAEGLALRTLLPQAGGGVNFLTPYYAQTRPRVNLRRELATCGVFVLAIALIWVVGLFLRRAHLESQYEQIKAQQRDIFRQTLPQEKNIVNPLAQLQQKLDAFRDESALLSSFQPGGRTPLEVLEVLSTHCPNDGSLQLDDLLISADSARVKGRCDKFAVLSDWQRALEEIPGFEIAGGPTPSEKDAQTDKVRFTLSLSTRKTVQ